MSECYRYPSFILAIPDGSGKIRAGLPFMKVKSFLTGHRWVSLPFSDYCIPLYRENSDLEKLVESLVNISREKQTGKIEVRWKLPEHPGLHLNSEFVLHTIKLAPDSGQVAKQFKRTHLQNIRTAEERGVTVDFGDKLEHVKVFYQLQLETRKRHGVPSQPWKYFELLWENIIRPGLGFVLLAKNEGKYIAGMVYLCWGRTLIAKYAASLEDSFNLRPNNLLFWEGIRWGCQNGYQVFDMGRTEVENSGLRNFKCRWGAVEEPLFYSTFSPQASQPINGRVTGILHTLIKRSPLWVCKWSGEILYRHFA
jgi:hypothetical protein